MIALGFLLYHWQWMSTTFMPSTCTAFLHHCASVALVFLVCNSLKSDENPLVYVTFLDFEPHPILSGMVGSIHASFVEQL